MIFILIMIQIFDHFKFNLLFILRTFETIFISVNQTTIVVIITYESRLISDQLDYIRKYTQCRGLFGKNCSYQRESQKIE